MAEFFGDLERLAADLYPYRWLISIGMLAAVAAVLVIGYQRGWHLWVSLHRVPVAAVGVPLLALTGFIAYDLGSPLFTNVTVEEEFPFAQSAILPKEVEREALDTVMAVMAKVEQEPAKEPMPKEMMTPVAAGSQASAAPT